MLFELAGWFALNENDRWKFGRSTATVECLHGMEYVLANYRNGLRIGLWLLAIFGGLAGVSLILWGLLAALGDDSGVVVVRVLLLVWLSALLVDLIALVAALTWIQLNVLERDRPRNEE